MALSKVLILGLYDDIYVDLEKFDVERYQALLEYYRQSPEIRGDTSVDEPKIRNFVSLILMDEHYENEMADDESIRRALKDSGKRVDELPLSLVL